MVQKGEEKKLGWLGYGGQWGQSYSEGAYQSRVFLALLDNKWLLVLFGSKASETVHQLHEWILATFFWKAIKIYLDI